MKTFILLALLTIAGGAFAETAADVKSAAGAIVSFAAADTAKATPAVLVVKVADKDQSFVVDAKTVVQDKDMKAVDVSTVKAGAKVVVQYKAVDKALDAVTVSIQ